MASHRDWVRERRARTRHLIELGGLVVKAGLVDRVDDDRATLLGGLLLLRDLLDGHGDDRPADVRVRWRRRGLRDFDASAAAVAAVKAEARQGDREEGGGKTGSTHGPE